MSSPAADDDWDDLARELGVSKSDPHPAPPPDMVERIIGAEAVEPHHGDPRAEDDAFASGEPELVADEDAEDAEAEPAAVLDGEPAGGATDGETPPAEGDEPERRKKRRRRRRRRKSAPADGTAPATGPDDDAAEPDEDELEAEAEVAESAEVADADGFDDPGTEADEEPAPEFEPVGIEEDTASEVLRDLIANWNVPSWDEIVGGLYRPN